MQIKRHNPTTLNHAAAAVRKIALPVLAVITIAATGCGSNQNSQWLTVYPAAGSVKIDGQSPVGAFIVLHPKTDAGRAPDGEIVRPHGVVHDDGTFELTSYSSNDGAPVGEYIVTLELRKVIRFPSGEAGPGPNLVPSKYAVPSTSPLVVRIEATTNELPPIVVHAARPEKQTTAARVTPQATRGL